MNEASSRDRLIITKLTEIVWTNLEKENFGVSELAFASGMSRSSLSRKIKSAVRKTTSQFIREIRLEKAMEMLQSGLSTAAEISYHVGFNSPTYFNSCFHHYFGYPPGEVKKRHIVDSEGISENGNASSEMISHHSTPEIHSFPMYSLFRKRNLIEASSVIIAIICLAFIWYLLFFRNATMLDLSGLKAGDKSLVVLPFKNLSDNSENRYFADGVVDDITNHLFRIRDLRVISRTTGDNYKDKTFSATEISHQLGVNFILEGSVQQHNGRVRIIVQLVDARRDLHLWSEKYDCDMADIFLIQSRIAKQIADELQTVLSTAEIERINKVPTMNTEAYNYYLKGRFNSALMSEEGIKSGISFFELAVAADPDYALAYSSMADAYYIQAWWGWAPFTEGYCKAKEFAIRALELDNQLPDAHAILGAVLCWNDWNWEGGEKEFVSALELDPTNAISHQYYSEYLDVVGNNIEARRHIDLALKLDPVSPAAYFLSALYYYHEGKFEESLMHFRKVEQLNGDPYLLYFRYFDIFYWRNEGLNAAESLQKIVALKPTPGACTDVVNDVYNSLEINSLLKWLIQTELKKEVPKPLLLAKWNARLGKKNEALKWLGYSYELHLPGLPQINNDPDFEILRREPRFKEILKQMGLSDYQFLRKPSQLKSKPRQLKG